MFWKETCIATNENEQSVKNKTHLAYSVQVVVEINVFDIH